MGLKIPSVNQLMSFAVTMLVLLFVVRILPIPENIKNLFRI